MIYIFSGAWYFDCWVVPNLAIDRPRIFEMYRYKILFKKFMFKYYSRYP